jgi:hypothetical protein
MDIEGGGCDCNVGFFAQQRKGKLRLCVPKHANQWCDMHTCESCKAELPSKGKVAPLPITRALASNPISRSAIILAPQPPTAESAE